MQDLLKRLGLLNYLSLNLYPHRQRQFLLLLQYYRLLLQIQLPQLPLQLMRLLQLLVLQQLVKQNLLDYLMQPSQNQLLRFLKQ